ncbi:MAG TPA: hypothetical protein PKA58_08470 [Polyangium sp.]|nr:hypothetical protein [Polyangium sp.]
MTNRLFSLGHVATWMLALASCAAFVACGPTARTETNNSSAGAGVGGAGGGDTGGAGGTGTGTAGGGTMPASSTLTEIDLGPKKLNVLLGFDVPENALGITAIVEAPTLTDVIGVSRLRNPAGDYVTFDYSVMGKANFAFVRQGWIGAATVQSDLPQAWPVQAGLWRILLGSDGPLDSANVKIWVRHTADGAFHGGVIDVNVFVAPNGAPQSYLDFVVSNLFNDYAGLALGNVNYLDLDGSFSIIDTYDQYRALLASSASAKGTPALNMFVINKFGAEFGQAIGVAGGIPGSATLHGTTMSGVAYMPSGDPNYDVTVLRHEIGHLAGLFHTTEMATEDTDPISDTVECDPGTIQSKPEQCPDVSNTMFPIAFGSTDLTAAQQRVIQGSALYRGVWAAGDAPDAPSNAVAPQPKYKPLGASFVVDFSDKRMSAHASPLERVLGGVWCADGRADYEALAIRVAGASAAQSLRALAVDASRADLLRTRALGAYVRAATGAERTRALELADKLALDADAPGGVRVGALDTLVRFDAARARAASSVLSSTSHPVLRELSKRLLTP